MTALAALAAAAIVPPEGVAPPPSFEAAIREACAGAWRAVEVVLAGDVLRGRLGKTRDAIVRDAVEALLAIHGNAPIRADALASLRAARDAGELDGALDLDAVIAEVRAQGAVAIGRAAVAAVRDALADYRDLEQVLVDDLAMLLVDAARAIFRTRARDPELARWAIGPTGSPGRDRALSAFAELATSPDSIDELETLIAVPIALDDNVQFTIYRPRSIDPGRWHQLLAFAHLAERRPGEDELPDPVEEVQRQAAQVLGDKAKHYAPVIQDSGAAIPAEGELTFVPEFPGIEVNPPRRSFLWLESVHREEFRIRAGRELDGKTVRGRVTVFLGSIAIAEVACAVRVDAARPEPKREPTTVRAYRKIFASYSHRDLEVVNQFETYARALGDEYLRDWVHLRTGEVWTDRLCQLIEQADAFQLFWSRNSMHSQFVRQEYEHALSLNRPSFVRPTYWEDPMPTAPGLPPEALLRLHFQKLGGGVALGRTEEPKLIARKKRAEMVIDRERDDTSVDAAAIDHARAYKESEADFDVTDPQYSLPEMPAAEASSSMPAAPPVRDDYADEEPSTLADEAPSLAGAKRESRGRSRSITTEPGIGTVKRSAVASKSVAPSPKSKTFPTTAPGIAPRKPDAEPSSAKLDARPAPSARPASTTPPAIAAAALGAPSIRTPSPSVQHPVVTPPTELQPMGGPPRQQPMGAPPQPMQPAPVAPSPAPGPAAPSIPSSPRAPSMPVPSIPSARPSSAPPSARPSAPSMPGAAHPASPSSAPSIGVPSTLPGTRPPSPREPAPSPFARSQPTQAPSPDPAPSPFSAPPAMNAASPPLAKTMMSAEPSPPPTIEPAADGWTDDPALRRPSQPITASQRTSFAIQPDEPAFAPPPGPIPNTTPGHGPPPSAWARPDTPVSPFAATVPHQAYNPQPGDPLYVEPEITKQQKGAVSAEARRSKLPLVLIAIGVLALAAVLLIWLLG